MADNKVQMVVECKSGCGGGAKEKKGKEKEERKEAPTQQLHTLLAMVGNECPEAVASLQTGLQKVWNKFDEERKAEEERKKNIPQKVFRLQRNVDGMKTQNGAQQDQIEALQRQLASTRASTRQMVNLLLITLNPTVANRDVMRGIIKQLGSAE